MNKDHVVCKGKSAKDFKKQFLVWDYTKDRNGGV